MPWIAMVVIAVLGIPIVARPLTFSDLDPELDDSQRDAIKRRRRVLIIVFGVAAEVALAIMQWGGNCRWLLFLGLLPASFVIQHGINIAVFKNPRFLDGGREPSFRELQPELVPIVEAALIQEKQYYSTVSLTLRFVLPAVVLFFAILTVGYTLEHVPDLGPYVIDPTLLQGAQIGAVGAYVYVVLYLGTRAMRGDVTSGAIMWSSVTMVGGPLLAAAVDLVFVGKAVTSPSDSPDITWTTLFLPFAAGFSMRVVVDFVNRKIRQLFSQRPATARGESLLRLRGISYDVEERLVEEGVEDIANLAMTNPHRLRRNTRFDKRQISAWIDEALLALYFPTAWQTLETNGITGAIDLVWYVAYLGEAEIRAIGKCPVATTTPSAAQTCLEKLADRNNLNAFELAQIMLRMYEDAQVRLIWGLYQLDDTEATRADEWFTRFRPDIDKGTVTQASASVVLAKPDDATVGAAVWKGRYDAHRGWFLIHRWRPSSVARYADIVIRPWSGRGAGVADSIVDVRYTVPEDLVAGGTFTASAAEDRFALRVRAKHSFFCVARVRFQNAGLPELVLERFVDFDTRQKIVAAD